jgi:peroxiredoxin
MKNYWVGLLSVFLGVGSLRAADMNSTNEHANLLGEGVLRLLESRDADRFANEMALTNQFNQRVAADSARLVLAQATRMGLEPSRVRFRLKDVLAKATGTTQKTHDIADGLPLAFGIRIVLLGEAVRDALSDKPFQGEYELALGGATEFPDGWRTFEGIRWSRLPDSVADDRTKGEMILVSNIVAHVGEPLHAADDPALRALGSTLIRFLRQRDERIYATEAMPSFEETWQALLKKLQASGLKDLPARREFEDGWNMMRGQLVESAQGVLAQAEVLGIDFSGAEIALKDVIAEHPYMRGGYGSVEGITAEPLRFTLSVKSDRNGKGGHPIAGEYTLTAGRGQRNSNQWTIQDKIRWERFPEGLPGEKERADLAFENFVGERGVLPPGTAAPDVEFARVDDGTSVKLSDFRGKVVVLEWWATWCGPCQVPMAELQELLPQHPEWKDRVQIIALSINDEVREAQAHLAKRGWTNTFNAWAGPNGWLSAPARQFRLHAVPTCYVIDLQGKVVQAGSPWGLSITNVVARLLQ